MKLNSQHLMGFREFKVKLFDTTNTMVSQTHFYICPLGRNLKNNYPFTGDLPIYFYTPLLEIASRKSSIAYFGEPRLRSKQPLTTFVTWRIQHSTYFHKTLYLFSQDVLLIFTGYSTSTACRRARSPPTTSCWSATSARCACSRRSTWLRPTGSSPTCGCWWTRYARKDAR